MARKLKNETNWVKENTRILLFDIDGVLVTKLVSATNDCRTLLRLHPDISSVLRAHDITYGFITHRSREQAILILAALDITPVNPELLICANDLAYEGVLRLKPFSLIRNGILKSFAFPLLKRRVGVSPHQIAVIDDRSENLDDLSKKGCGLVMKSPSTEMVVTRDAVSFDINESIQQFHQWSKTTCMRKVDLKAQSRYLGDWSTISSRYNRDPTTLFSSIRSWGKRARSFLKLK